MSLEDYCVDIYTAPEFYLWYNIPNSYYLLVPIWIVGILGNLMNIVVFRRKSMASNSINLIFWWLSISDLLELAILPLYRWHYSKCCNGIDTVTNGAIFDNIFDCIIFLLYMYLFQVIHTVTIGLNIVLVFYQHKVVAYPLTNHKSPFSGRCMKLAVICMYILSFILYLPYWYIHEILQVPKNPKYYGIYLRGFSNPSHDGYKSGDPLVNVCILVCGVVLRIKLLIILIILSIRLLFAIRNAHCYRQNLGMQASHLSKAQRNVNRMNVTIVLIIIMFFITEVPLALSSFLIMFENSVFCSYAINESLLYVFILLNCSYSIFCYFIRIKKYRATLKFLLSETNWFHSRASVVEQTDLELHSL